MEADPTAAETPVLTYATPAPTAAFARAPLSLVVLLGVAVPGLSSWLLRGRAGAAKCLALCGGVAAAFAFFGPFWGEVLFHGTRWKNAGLWPFVGCCAIAGAVGGLNAVWDHRRAGRGGPA